MDEDLDRLDRESLIGEVKRLCWHHPKLWGLLPERIEPAVAVPPWATFIRGCVAYRQSLDRELPGAPVVDVEYEG